MEVYDGWILRFFPIFYTHWNQLCRADRSLFFPWKIRSAIVKNIQKMEHSCIFKISPVSDPSLDWLLEKRGYRIEHRINVMTMDIPLRSEFPNLPLYRRTAGLIFLNV